MTKPTSVHDELAKLVPVLTEAARRQDPQRAMASDCRNWIDGATLACGGSRNFAQMASDCRNWIEGACTPKLSSLRWGDSPISCYTLGDSTCPRDCGCYKPRSMA